MIRTTRCMHPWSVPRACPACHAPRAAPCVPHVLRRPRPPAGPAGVARDVPFDDGWRFQLGDASGRRAARLRRLVLAQARPAPRLEHREPAEPRRREALGAVRQGARAPGRARRAGWSAAPAGTASASACRRSRPTGGSRCASTASYMDTRRLAQRPAWSGTSPTATRRFAFDLTPLPRPHGRERARGPRAQRGEEQPLVLGLGHLPPRLADHDRRRCACRCGGSSSRRPR